jgi:PTH2 family peptidyl-tRNA hydrolase
MDYKQVIVLRKDLNMRKGKMAAQAAHASMAAILNCGTYTEAEFSLSLDDRIKPWITGQFKKIVVSVDTEEDLKEIFERAKQEGLITSFIVDSGLTEFNGIPTPTAVAVGPDRSDKIDTVCKHLPLL